MQGLGQQQRRDRAELELAQKEFSKEISLQVEDLTQKCEHLEQTSAAVKRNQSSLNENLQKSLATQAEAISQLTGKSNITEQRIVKFRDQVN